MRKTFAYKQSIISYYAYGYGTEVVFCFHGYGLDGSCFNYLEETLGNKYTLICIDFPFHGQTIWNEGNDFSRSNLLEILTILNPNKTNTYSFLGYSMGGRIALSMYTFIPSLIKQVLLLAPDGLKRNYWQQFATRTFLGEKIFKLSMQYPSWLFAMVNTVGFMHLLNKSRIKFIRVHIGEKKERDLLHKRWMVLKDYQVDLNKVSRLINKYQVPVTILIGAFDKVITKKSCDQFKRKQSLVTIKTLETGHDLLKPKFAKDIASLFK